MIRLTLLSILSILGGNAAPALADTTPHAAPREFSWGTKPAVWTLRSGSYSDRFLRSVPANKATVERSPADAKPAGHTVRAATHAAEHRAATATASVDACWGEKAVVRALAPRCAPEPRSTAQLAVSHAGRRG